MMVVPSTDIIAMMVAMATTVLLWAVIAKVHSSSDGLRPVHKNATETPETTATVYIVRHGEKTYGGGCLNIQGQERANNFPQLFNSTNANKNAANANRTNNNIDNNNNNNNASLHFFQTPTAIFANNYFNTWGNCERCLLTVMPISQALGLPIDFKHGFPEKFGSNAAGADAIRKTAASAADNKKNPPSVILVAWEHVNIQYLTADLGVPKDEIPYWDDDDYDSVYVLKMNSLTGRLLSFNVTAQNYVPKSTTCDPPNYVPPPEWNPPQQHQTLIEKEEEEIQTIVKS